MFERKTIQAQTLWFWIVLIATWTACFLNIHTIISGDCGLFKAWLSALVLGFLGIHLIRLVRSNG